MAKQLSEEKKARYDNILVKPGGIAGEARAGKLSLKDRVELESYAITKYCQRKKYTREKIEIEIVDIEEIEGGVSVFARAWQKGKQIGFGEYGSIDVERFRIFNPHVLVTDPNGTIERKSTESDGRVVTQRFREDPEEALLRSLEVIIRQVGKDDATIVAGSVGNTVTTVYPLAGTTGPMDGIFTRITSTTFASLRSGAGTHSAFTDTTGNFVELRATANTDLYNVMARSGFSFDTSAIDTDIISSAVLSLYANTDTADTDFGENPDCDIVSFTPASSNYLISDYAVANWGSTVFSSVSFSTFRAGIGDYVEFTLDSNGIANINKTGTTHFGARYSRDVDDSAPTWAANDEARINCSFADNTAGATGTDQDPMLVVTHAAIGSSPSSSPSSSVSSSPSSSVSDSPSGSPSSSVSSSPSTSVSSSPSTSVSSSVSSSPSGSESSSVSSSPSSSVSDSPSTSVSDSPSTSVSSSVSSSPSTSVSDSPSGSASDSVSSSPSSSPSGSSSPSNSPSSSPSTSVSSSPSTSVSSSPSSSASSSVSSSPSSSPSTSVSSSPSSSVSSSPSSSVSSSVSSSPSTSVSSSPSSSPSPSSSVSSSPSTSASAGDEAYYPLRRYNATSGLWEYIA